MDGFFYIKLVQKWFLWQTNKLINTISIFKSLFYGKHIYSLKQLQINLLFSIQ